MIDINKIYEMLNWKNSDDVQAEGLKMIRKVDDLSLLITPPAPPSVWEHCATVLSEKSDDELEPYLDKLLEWLQDLNWPGATIIAERLKKISGEKLLKPLKNATIKASETSDEMWLDYLSELLDNNVLVSKLPEEILTILKKHYHAWGNW